MMTETSTIRINGDLITSIRSGKNKRNGILSMNIDKIIVKYFTLVPNVSSHKFCVIMYCERKKLMLLQYVKI